MKVLRKPQHWESLQTIEDYIAHDDPSVAIDLWLSIDDPVGKLNAPPQRGRVSGALELVVHPNCV